MARTFVPQDAHVIMSALVKQATGQQSATIVDTSSFVSAGELVLSTGTENVLNSLTLVLGRLIVSAKAYNGKLALMNAVDTGVFTNRLRKVSFYSKDALPAGFVNTNLFENLHNGYTAGENKDSQGDAKSTKSQWEQHPPIALEMNFGGSSVWSDCYTVYESALQTAFRGEEEFMAFVAGFITEHQNDIMSQREAFNRMVLLNKIGQIYDMSAVMPQASINLTQAFNTRYGTNYTSAELRGTYLKQFLPFMVAMIKEVSDRMEERSALYHWSPVKVVDGETYTLLKHTPKADQHIYLYSELFKEAESLVLPEIFHEGMISLDNYEAVTYWQSNASEADRPKVKVTPAIINTSNGQQIAGDAVNLDYVVGLITSKDGLMTNMQLERTATTPLEARKLYRNTWAHFQKGSMVDPTEPAVLLYMAD